MIILKLVVVAMVGVLLALPIPFLFRCSIREYMDWLEGKTEIQKSCTELLKVMVETRFGNLFLLLTRYLLILLWPPISSWILTPAEFSEVSVIFPIAIVIAYFEFTGEFLGLFLKRRTRKND